VAGVGSLNVKELKKRLRNEVWRVLEERNIAKFPRPVYGRIPNFIGSEVAAHKLTQLEVFRRAKVVKVNPDSPQQPVRLTALREGKLVIMPTPRLREGFLLIDPSKIPRYAIHDASTIRGAFRWGIKVKPWDLPKIDLIVIGSVVIDRKCLRVGKGGGYAELEYGILKEVGVINNSTPIVTTVHDVQLLNVDIPPEPHDLYVDLIITPSRIIKCSKVYRPKGIYWELITKDMLIKIPVLAELKSRLNNLKGLLST